MTANNENERHEIIRSIFQTLDKNEPTEAANMRDSFHTVWEQLYQLGEHLESNASQFTGKQKQLLLEEHRRIQTMLNILSESYLPVVMPDDTNVLP